MKTIIREILAMIVLVAAIILITVIVFFDYIKGDANQPQPAIYEVSKEEQNILKEKEQYEKNKETLVLKSMYSVDESELSALKASGEFQQGQSSPFDETPIMDILRDSEGNIYYQINNTATKANTTGNNTTSNTAGNNTNSTKENKTQQPANKAGSTNTPQAYKADSDISTSSASSGSMETAQRKGMNK